MENESSPARPDGRAAHDVLRHLDADRTALAGRMSAPGWTHVAFALLATGFVVLPGFADGVRPWAHPFLALAVGGLLWYQHSVTGVRARSAGPRAWAAFGGAVVAVLVLLMVSLGLAASLSPWWVIAPGVLTFVVVLAANRAFERFTVEHVRHGR